jgi:anti-sigma regulatory factor (Ser/Thr protein kinase)
LSRAGSKIAGQSFEFRLDGGPTAAFEARRAVLAADGSLPAPLRDDLLLLVTELVTNAVRHAPVGPEQSIRVAIDEGPGRVRVEVADPGGRFTRAHPRHRPDESGGWGLVLVDRIADRWGVRRTARGTSVWCEIAGER